MSEPAQRSAGQPVDADPVIITCAVTGGMTVPGQSAAIPITPEQIVESAVAAHHAGAALLHVHVREPSSGRPVADPALFAEVVAGIGERCDAIVQPTTGGGANQSMDQRARVVEDLRPEMASFNTGSFNFGLFRALRRGSERLEPWEVEYLEGTRDFVFANTFAQMEELLGRFRAAGVRPEFEVYDVGHLFNLAHLVDERLAEPPLHIQFVLGVLGAAPARIDQLMHLLATARDVFGDRFTWSAAGIGYPAQFQFAALALMLGGDVRVGLEDNLRVARGRRATTNAELVAKAVAMAALHDRRPASPAEARRILSLPARAGSVAPA